MKSRKKEEEVKKGGLQYSTWKPAGQMASPEAS